MSFIYLFSIFPWWMDSDNMLALRKSKYCITNKTKVEENLRNEGF